MINSYNYWSHSRFTWLKKSIVDNVGSPPLKQLQKSSWLVMFLMFLFVTFGQKAFAQSTANYAFSTNVTGSLAADMNSNAIDMTTGTTQLVAADTDDASSAATAIGFNYTFMGTTFSQFSASSNGVVQLGSTAVSSTTYVLSGGTTASPRIGAFAADLRTGSSGKVHFKLIGTAPNRCLVVEFLNMSLTFVSSPGSNDGTYQVRLYESTGALEYVYGSMFRNASTTTSAALNVGFSVGSTINTTASITTSSNTVSNAATFNVNSYTTSANIPNLHSTTNGSRRVYQFTPPSIVSGDVTSLTFTSNAQSTTTVNFVDNASNEFGFIVTRATDSAFTTGVVTTSVTSSTSAGTGTAYNSIQTGLLASTTYFYRIQAAVEAGLSTGITGSQATLAPIAPICAPTVSPLTGATGVAAAPTLTWSGFGGAPAPTFNVFFSTNSALVTAMDVTVRVLNATSATTYAPTGLVLGTTYYWMVVPSNSGGGPTSCSVNSFTVLAPATFTSTANGGLWSSATTWVGGVVPPAGNDVTIAAGSTVTADQSMTYRNLTINGTMQWNATAPSSTTNFLTLTSNLNVNSGGRLLAYNAVASPVGSSINVAGNFVNDGYVNLAYGFLQFNGTGSTLSGSGTFEGDGTRGIIKGFTSFSGNNTISTSQNLTLSQQMSHLSGTLNTNGKLRLDNTALIYGRPLNTEVASVAVTGMGSGYTAAPVASCAGAAIWASGATLAIGNVRTTATGIYLCTTGGTSGTSAPVHTSGTATATGGTAVFLWLAPAGTIGTPYISTTLTLGTQYFYGGNLYTAVATTAAALAVPTHTSGTVGSFRYAGSAARVSVNWDATTSTVRSLNLVSAGSGYSSAPAITFAAAAGTGAAATAVVIQSLPGFTFFPVQKTGSSTLSGGLTINSDQGVTALSSDPQASSGVGALFTTNGGVNYTAAPQLGFSGPTALNLVTNAGSGYTSAPTITVTGGTQPVGSTGLATGDFTITVNQGKVVSVYMNTAVTKTYITPPTLTFTGGGGSGATLAFPTNCWPAATASIGTNGQITNFTITNSGYGYVAAPTVAVGTTSGTPTGGTYTTVMTAPTARIAAYQLILNFFTPATSNVTQTNNDYIPSSRKMHGLWLNGTLGSGLTLTDNLTLISAGTSTTFGTFPPAPLVLTASSSTSGNVFDLGTKNLRFTWNGYAGTTPTFGATNAFVRNGSMILTTRGGAAAALTYPFSGAVVVNTGTTPTVATTGSDILTVKVSDTVAPSNTVATGTAIAVGTRAFKVETATTLGAAGTAGTNPQITLGYNSQDALTSTQDQTFVAEASSLSGAWNLRSASVGASGALTATGTRSTATVAPGPISLANNSFYAWANGTPTITSVAPLIVCANSGTFTITGTNLTGVTAVSIGGTPVTAFTVVSATTITGFAGEGTTGVVTVVKNGATITGTETVTVSSSPIAPSVTPNSASIVMGQSPSFTATGGGGTFNWYDVATGGVALVTGSATYAPTVCATKTFYVAENNGSCEGARTPVVVTVQPFVITPTTGVFCGTGGTTTLNVSPVDPSVTYTWSFIGSGATFSGSNVGSSVNANIVTTSDFTVTATSGACSSAVSFSVSVYPLPSATVTSTASGVCPGTPATIDSGLSAGNFTSVAISHAPRTAPVTAVTLANDGVATVPLTSGNLDDGGWGAIPVGFNFNFFGTSYSTINIGTNGTVQFGTYSAAGLGDFTFTTLPNPLEPLNMVAVLAIDNYIFPSGVAAADGSVSGTPGGAIKYWTEGVSPNRRFIVSYENVREYGDTRTSTAQAIFYETTGIIEPHITSSTNQDRVKLVGVNNNNGTVGVLAYNSGTAATTNPQNPITNPFAFRFSPPANYTTVWTKTDTSGTSTIASGTNIFTQSVAPSQTTTYTISYTNQTTGCTNALNSAQVTMNVLSNTAPSGVSTQATPSSVCFGSPVTLFTDYTGSTAGLSYQWEVSTNGGLSFTPILGATSAIYSETMVVPSQYRVAITSCTGSPVYATPVSVNFTNNIATTTSATRCGVGSVSLQATTLSAGATINWYTAETGGSPVGTGSPFTIASLPLGTTTYYVAAETTGPACSSPRVAVTATATTPPSLTLSAATATVCSGASSSAITITNGSSSYDTYSWSPSTGVSGNALTGWSFNPTVSGTYTLTASQSAGDCTTTATVIITVNNPNVTTAVSTTPICLGASTTISASSSASGPSTLPGVYCVPVQSGGSAISSITFNTLSNTTTQVSPFYDIYPATGTTTTNLVPGQTYPLTITTSGTSIVSVWFDWNRDGVFTPSEWTQPWTAATTGTVNITVPSNAVFGATGMRIRTRLNGNTNGDSSACDSFGSGTTQDYTVNVQVDGTSSYTYSWSPGGATTASVSVTPTTAGTTTYTVTATSPEGCVTTGTVDVLVNTDPVATITDGAAAMCIGLSTIDFNNATNGVSWSSSNPSVATVDANGTVTALTTGTTTINAFISNPSTGCTTFAANPQTVTVYAPISITSQPIGQSILTGDNTQLSVTATGSGLSYQWFSSTNAVTGFTPVSNSAIFSGAASATLNITAASAALNGLYFRCEISGTSPCTSPINTNAVLLTVESISVTNPLNQTLCSTTTSTSFSVVAGGNYEVIFWEVFDLDTNTWIIINNGDTFGGLTFSGENSQTLVVNDITISNNLYQFRANVDDGNVTITSEAATLFVNSTASISSQPSDKSICYTGGTNTFRVTASNAIGFQWQYATSASGPWSNVVNGTPVGATYANATSNILGVATTSATPASGTYFYQVVVSSASPCPSVTSNAVQLSINTPSITAVSSNPFICQPVSTGVTLTGSGAGVGGSYVWAPTTGLTGTGAVVTANPTVTTTYTVTGTDSTGCSNTASVTVMVGPALTATATATPSIVCSGADTQLQANYTPVILDTSSNFTFVASSGTYTPITGGTVSSASGDDSTQFPITIGFPFTYNGTTFTEFGLSTNGHIRLGADAAGFTNGLATNDNILAPLWDDNNTAAGNISYQLSGTPGSQVLTIQWENVSIGGSGSSANSVNNYQVQLFEGTNVVKFNYGNLVPNSLSASIGITGASGNFLSVTPLAPASSSTVSSSTANNSIASVANIPSGTSYTFTPPVLPTISYSWSPATFLSATNIANPMATAVNASTTYTVTVTSSTGCSASTTVAVTLSSGIAITTQPAAASFCQGTTATLSVVASGSGLTYQWRKGGVDIVGQTAATLSIPTVALTDSGSYDVVINDACVSTPVTSTAAILTINPTPTATAPGNQVACSGVATAAIALTGTPSGVTYNVTGGAAIGLANQTGVTAIPSFTPTAGTATISVTPVANGCSGTAVTFTYTVNATPTAITITPSSSTIGCSDGPVLLSAAGGIVPPAGYCIPTVANVDVDFINNFSYAGIVNNGTGQTAGQYVDYTSLVANVVAGVSTPFSVQSGSGSSQFFGIYVDLNQNAIFETNEFLGSTTTGTTAVVNGTITIPTTALNGTTRLRVASRWNNALTSANACSNPGWGEYEDYSVNITGGTAPAPSLYVWSSQNGGLFTNAAGTVPYDGTTPRATIYAKPTATGTVTASRTVASCPTSGSTTVTVDICDSVVNLKLFIQGYYDDTAGEMRPVKFNQDGVSSLLDVETLTIELHDATTPATIVASTTAMLHTDGTLQAVFNTAPSGSFYIAVKGSNMVQTWSGSTQTVGTTPLTYDFSTGASKSYNSNMAETSLGSGVWAFYSGDINQDEVIDGSDSTDLINDIENANFGLLATDLNGDGVVDGSDSTTLINNTENAVFSDHP